MPPKSSKTASKSITAKTAPATSQMSKEDIELFFAALQKKDPHPKGELEYVNHFTLLVAVVLSAQATDAGVNKATRKLFEKAPTPEKMVALGLEGITEHIRTIGLYRNKAKNVLALSQQLIDEHDSTVPDNREALEKLPGVGRKTANVVLNIAFGHPTMAVDTHIFRIGNRTGLAPGKNVLEVEKKLLQVIPDQYRLHAHHWLILQGRYICKARNPLCTDCLVEPQCRYREKKL